MSRVAGGLRAPTGQPRDSRDSTSLSPEWPCGVELQPAWGSKKARWRTRHHPGKGGTHLWQQSHHPRPDRTRL